MPSGGERTPSSPAPASGPGRLARRTDGGPGQKLQAPGGMAYGDKTGMLDQERSAAMSQANPISSLDVPSTPNPPSVPSGTQRAQGTTPPGYQGVPFGAATQRPHEPVTSGVDIGPGPGSEAMAQPPQQNVQAKGPLTQALGQMPLSGELAALYQAASVRGV